MQSRVTCCDGECHALWILLPLSALTLINSSICRIGTCRKKVMGLLRLMGNKADVVKGLAKRCNENWSVAPKSDIGLYLSDIQDHLVTMTQKWAFKLWKRDWGKSVEGIFWIELIGVFVRIQLEPLWEDLITVSFKLFGSDLDWDDRLVVWSLNRGFFLSLNADASIYRCE